MLRYQEGVAFTGSVGAVNAYVFSANGCYDPNITGTGHQPMGFDQMMTIYDHYTVLNAFCRLQVWNTHGTQVCKVGLMVDGDATGWSTNYQTNIESGQITYATLSPNGLANSMCELAQRVNIAAQNGLQDPLDSHDMRGDVANNPAEQTYFIITLWNPQTATAPTIYFDVIIEYDVVFTEPRLGTQS